MIHSWHHFFYPVEAIHGSTSISLISSLRSSFLTTLWHILLSQIPASHSRTYTTKRSQSYNWPCATNGKLTGRKLCLESILRTQHFCTLIRAYSLWHPSYNKFSRCWQRKMQAVGCREYCRRSVKLLIFYTPLGKIRDHEILWGT